MLGTPRILRYSPVRWAVTMREVRTTSRKDSRSLALDVERIPLHVGYYLAGFADGEGSFHVAFRKRRDYRTMPWKISLCFNVSQRDKAVLEVFQEHLRCGSLRTRSDGVWYFEVNGLEALSNNVVPFFERFGFLSDKKKRDFAKFQRLVALLVEGRHLRREGLREILQIRSDMNDGGAERRKYSDAQILHELGESSEAIR